MALSSERYDSEATANTYTDESTPLLPSHASLSVGSTSVGGEAGAGAGDGMMIWQEMRTIPKFAFPVLGSLLLEFSLIIVEVVSVGHISTSALAAVSLGSMTANVTGMSMLAGLSSALETLLPSAYTSSRPELVGLWSQRMAVVLVLAMIPILTIWLNAEPILIRLKQDPEIARLAGLYLRWLALGLPAASFNNISRRYFQSQGHFAIQTRIMLIVAPVNVLLNYLLVWGNTPFKLGFIGAPISTVISYMLVSLISIYYGIWLVPRTAWHPISWKVFHNLGMLTSLGLSGIGQIATEWWAWEILALAASFLGPSYLASQSVLITSATTTWHVGFAISNASAVRVGNHLGARDTKRARAATIASLILAFASSMILSSLYMSFRSSWARMFTNDPEVILKVTAVLPIIALFQVVDASACVVGGLLRAIGRQFTGALLNSSAYYAFGLPFGVWLAFYRDWRLHGLWAGVTVALLLCSIIGTTICLKTDWEHEMKRAHDRIAKEDRPRIKIGDDEESP